MSLPISDIVQVDIAVSPVLAPLAGFGELLYLTSEQAVLNVISPAERVRAFGSLAEVQDAFPLGDEVIRAAMAFYSQTPQPKDFSVGVFEPTAYAGTLTGGKPASLTELKKITAGGAFKVTIDGAEHNVANLNLSTANTYVEVATLVSNAIGSNQSAKVEYLGGRFIITSGTKGSTSIVNFPVAVANGKDLESLLGLTYATGAQAIKGGNETLTDALGKCLDSRGSFVAVANSHQYRDDMQHTVDIATWCEASKKIFLNTTNDVRVMDAQTMTSTVAYALKSKAFRYTITTFGIDDGEYPSCSLFGRIATVNYESVNSTITLKFKKLPGITALNLKTSQKSAMDACNVGGFMDFGGQLLYAESRMADNGWLDSVHGLMWLENRIQTDVFNLLYGTTTKIPATDTGVAMVVQKVEGALAQSVTNGLVGPGITPEGEFLPNGYKITAQSILTASPSDKSNRIYRGLSFKCIGAGALHNVVINGSFSE